MGWYGVGGEKSETPNIAGNQKGGEDRRTAKKGKKFSMTHGWMTGISCYNLIVVLITCTILLHVEWVFHYHSIMRARDCMGEGAVREWEWE